MICVGRGAALTVNLSRAGVRFSCRVTFPQGDINLPKRFVRYSRPLLPFVFPPKLSDLFSTFAFALPKYRVNERAQWIVSFLGNLFVQSAP